MSRPLSSVISSPPIGPCLYRGTIIHSMSIGNLQMLLDGAIVVLGDGTIAEVFDMNDDGSEDRLSNFMAQGVDVADFRGKLIIPGFVDGHAHAPQYAFAGTGMDMPLLKWLETHTFPVEARFKDSSLARMIYEKAVKRHLKYGTTTCSYFATTHLEATKVLVDVIRCMGQRAFVGKVSMDRNCPDYYREETQVAAREAEEFVQFASQIDDLITPVVTPRFVPSCTDELMTCLGEIARRYDVPVQSHLSETLEENKWVADLHPECDSYAGVYEKHGLMFERSYFAHCIHCSSEERAALRNNKAGVVHCPSSNFMLCSGVANVRRYVDEGVKVCLGTDVAGGYSASILEAIRQTIIATNVCSMQPDEDGTGWKPLNFHEAFHLATMGGAEVLGLSDVIGNFIHGKQFDALVIDPRPGLVDLHEVDGHVPTEGPFDLFPELDQGMQTAFEKFLFLGDDRNIERVYVGGNRVL